MAKKVPLGIRGQAEETVEHKHTLNHHNEKLPPIYSTPNMSGLMEWAAANAMLPFLDEGEISVGTAINIEHRAPTTIGDLVKTEAVLESHDDRFYVFRVTAHNGGRDRPRDSDAGDCESGEGGGAARQAPRLVSFATIRNFRTSLKLPFS
jgi:predicted thioesterase